MRYFVLKILHCFPVCGEHPAVDTHFHVPVIHHILGLGVDKADVPVIGRIQFLPRQDLHQQNLPALVLQEVNRLTPVTVGEEIRNDNRQSVARSGFTARDGGADVRISGEGQIFQLGNSAEERPLANQ